MSPKKTIDRTPQTYIMIIMEYIRRPIPLEGLEGYSVNEIGEVFARDGVSKISQNINSRGYYKVSLYVTGVGKRTFSVHRLVALAFIPVDDPTGLDVDHIDNNKLNNHVSNLQWLTRAENVAKSFQQGRVSPRKGQLSGKLTGLYLSHEAREILAGVENKSKFVSDLITKTPPSPKNTEPLNLRPFNQVDPMDAEKNIVEASPKVDANVLVDDLFNTPEPVADDHLAAGEFACCLNETRPCKHWVWDVATGDGYINSLSGRRMEVE